MRTLKNCRGQGTTEYIIMLAIVVGIALTIFYQPLKTAITTKVTEITGNVAQAGK